jgi:hypothetical protein
MTWPDVVSEPVARQNGFAALENEVFEKMSPHVFEKRS